MIFITHVLFAILICVVLKIPVDFGLFLGSTIPDIDYPYSFIGDIFSPLSEKIYKKFGHRGFTHSIFWSLLLGGLCFVETKFITLFIGYTTHIFLDMFTYTGVKLAPTRNVSFTLFHGPVETGSKTDRVLAIVFGALCMLAWILRYYLT